MPEQDNILVRIDGKTYRLDSDKPASLIKIPWPQRKRLIDILEAMKAAEYVETERSQKAEPQKDQPRESTQAVKLTKDVDSELKQVSTPSNTNAQDSDVLMQRFLAEQKNHKHSIPDKRSIYKWFLITFVIIFILVLML